MEAFLKGSKPKKDVELKEASKAPMKNIPWVEKYRPKKVKDIAYQNDVVSVLQKSLDGSDLPNLLFYGPPGTGKTSSILAAARELFGDLYKSRILELNASDERGIQVIRSKVKEFSQIAVHDTRPDGRPCPPFKIVILDEADSMTSAAQSALRRTMEKQTKSTRFCLICNYISRIIEPLTSRCSKFRFKPLTDEIIKERLLNISEQESLELEDGCLEEVLKISKGDLRKAITVLQSADRLNKHNKITPEDIRDISGVIPEALVESFFDVCKKRNLEGLDKLVQNMLLNGYPAVQLIYQLHDHVLNTEDLSDIEKSHIMDKLAVTDQRLMDGADEFLQFMDLAYSMFKLSNF